MEESSVEANSSPLATIEQIQKRLRRPPPLHSDQSSFPIPHISSPRKQGRNSWSPLIDLKKTKVTLEDYLNPVLLSTVRAKLMKRKVDRGEMKQWERDDHHQFKWPIDQLKMFKEDSGSKRRRNEDEEEESAVDLGNDTDLIGEDGDCGEGEVGCSPFGKFEVMALKKFKGGG